MPLVWFPGEQINTTNYLPPLQRGIFPGFAQPHAPALLLQTGVSQSKEAEEPSTLAGQESESL
jgi:hypothetical protein